MHWDRHPRRLLASHLKGIPWQVKPFLLLHSGLFDCLPEEVRTDVWRVDPHHKSREWQASSAHCMQVPEHCFTHRADSLLPHTKALLAETQPCMKHNEMDSQASFFFSFLSDWAIMPANLERKCAANEGRKTNYFPFTTDRFQFLNLNRIQDAQRVADLSVILQPHLLGKAANRRTLTNALAPSPAPPQLGTSLSLAVNVLALCLFQWPTILFRGLYIKL